MSRPEQAERNRALVLAAARRAFLARGYHGATLEQIADDAGFSKGVVYSHFDSKADLFLALLEARPGDMVLIAGKGHEKVQITREGTFPFDDVQVAKHELEQLGYMACAGGKK